MHLPGRKTNSLFVGSALLEGFIKELTTDGVMPPLDSLSVFGAQASMRRWRTFRLAWKGEQRL